MSSAGNLTDEEIFQRAKKMVVAHFQVLEDDLVDVNGNVIDVFVFVPLII